MCGFAGDDEASYLGHDDNIVLSTNGLPLQPFGDESEYDGYGRGNCKDDTDCEACLCSVGAQGGRCVSRRRRCVHDCRCVQSIDYGRKVCALEVPCRLWNYC